ncbi:MAG TPA: hypothetical protein VIM98_19850 [Dyella sp.]|uniref:hypothetical protein n=1 Tax=Dyella sp. TaxID=1869338 RepID=UPI002F9386B3
MLKAFCISAALMSFSFPFAAQAHACKWGNASPNMHINKLQYNGEYYPYVTLSDGKEYSLFGSYGVNTETGRAMLAVALTAITINATVDVCLSGDDVSSITIKQ